MARIGLTSISQNYVKTVTEPTKGAEYQLGKLIYKSQYLDVWIFNYRDVLNFERLEKKGEVLDKSQKKELEILKRITNTITEQFELFKANCKKMKVLDYEKPNFIDKNRGFEINSSLDLINMIEKNGELDKVKTIIKLIGFAANTSGGEMGSTNPSISNDILAAGFLYDNIALRMFDVKLYEIDNNPERDFGVTLANELGDIHFAIAPNFEDLRKDDYNLILKNMEKGFNVTFQESAMQVYRDLKTTIYSFYTEKMYKKTVEK